MNGACRAKGSSVPLTLFLCVYVWLLGKNIQACYFLKRPSGNGPLFAYLQHDSKIHHMGRKKDGGDMLVGLLSKPQRHREHTICTCTHNGDKHRHAVFPG